MLLNHGVYHITSVTVSQYHLYRSVVPWPRTTDLGTSARNRTSHVCVNIIVKSTTSSLTSRQHVNIRIKTLTKTQHVCACV